MLWQDYYRPETVEEALEILASAQGRAQLIAGGSDLVLQLKRGQVKVDALVGTNRIAGLDYIRWDEDRIEIGAQVTFSQIANSELLREEASLLAEACAQAASSQIRNVATIVGNIVNAQPAADALIALVTLNATLTVRDLSGRREIPVSSTCLSPGCSVIDPTREFITEVSFERLPVNSGTAYERLSQRRALTLPVIAAGAAVTLDETGEHFEGVRIAAGPVAPVPFRAEAAEQFLKGAPIDVAHIEEAARLTARDASPRDSLRGGSAYRKQMLAVITRKSLVRAVERSH